MTFDKVIFDHVFDEVIRFDFWRCVLRRSDLTKFTICKTERLDMFRPVSRVSKTLKLSRYRKSLFKKGFDFILLKHRNCFSASVINISQVFGSVLSGSFAGVIGRKKVILISSILMTSGWALIGFSDGNYHLLMAGRLIHGFAFLASVSQVYLAEISDAKRR